MWTIQQPETKLQIIIDDNYSIKYKENGGTTCLVLYNTDANAAINFIS